MLRRACALPAHGLETEPALALGFDLEYNHLTARACTRRRAGNRNGRTTLSFLFSWRRRIKEITRVRRVIEVLVRNGLGFLVEQLALDRFVPRLWRRRRLRAEQAASRRTMPERLRRTLEELGATWVKVGQFLSGRADLLPPAYIEELTKLLDDAPPVAIGEVREVILRELGAPVESLYARFDEVPIASASIGQVHRASLSNGQEVIVKVQRPGIEAEVEADLNLLLAQARFLERRTEVMREQNLVAIVEQLSRSLREELDYQREGRNAERVRANLASDPRFVVPGVWWDLTSRRVITMEYLQGIQFNELERLRAAGYDLASLAHVAVESYLTQIFENGFYQADPHPANLLVMGERIGILDFGNVGQLTESQKQLLGDMFLQILDEDVEGLARTIVKLGTSHTRPSVEAMERDLRRLMVRYWGVSLEELSVGEMIADIFKAARLHKVFLPADLAQLARTIVTMEGTGRALDPNLVLVEVLRPFAVRLVRARLSPIVAGRRALRAARQAADLVQDFPRRVDNLWDQLEAGDVSFGIELRHLSVMLTKLNSMVNRLAYAILVASLIIGSSLILLGGREAWVLPILGLGIPVAQIAFLGAVLAGVWLLISIIRSQTL
jgi:ubiquinone biosynthesis protein